VFTKITEALTLNADEPGTHIPWGSVIFQWANGITELDGPDGTLIFLAKDSEAAILPHPSGLGMPGESPATHIIGVPSGTHITNDPNNADITRHYLDGELILTLAKMSEDYPYPSDGR